jgi:hypothetical protein
VPAVVGDVVPDVVPDDREVDVITRLRWFVVGVVAGALGAVYGLFRLRQSRQRFADPDQVVDAVGGAMRTVGRTVRDAWDESRDAMTQAETELRDSYVERRPRLQGLE